jgi:hypothetical protein
MRRALIIVALATSVLAPVAAAELTQNGDLFVTFDGGISPTRLPRKGMAPVSVRIEGKIRTPAGHRQPSLRRISVALNRGGRLNSHGLPACRRREVLGASPAEALSSCGTALVGGGGFTARTALPDQPSFVFVGQILFFNAVDDGRPAILGHVFQTVPAQITRVIIFRIHRTSGTFGTIITGELPVALNRNGHLKSIFFQLSRRFTSSGRPTSYLSAGCATPPAVPVAAFPFARVSMGFDDGRTLTSTLVRTCRAK